MKTDVIILAILLILAVTILLTRAQNPIEIQLHDTYFVLDNFSLAVIIIGPPTFLIFLVRAAINRFQTLTANIGLAIGTMMVIFLVYEVVLLLTL